MSEDVTINIRDIQHYMYCPRRFALLEVNDDWAENAFVVKANLLHENVHSGERNFENKRKIVRSDVSVYNDDPKYNIFGVVDCIEFVRDKSGDYIDRTAHSVWKLWSINPPGPKQGSSIRPTLYKSMRRSFAWITYFIAIVDVFCTMQMCADDQNCPLILRAQSMIKCFATILEKCVRYLQRILFQSV